MLPYLKPDGTYDPNPWLTSSSSSPPSPSDQAQAESSDQTTRDAQDASQDSESKPVAQRLWETVLTARLIQQDTAEPASLDSASHDATSAAGQQAEALESSFQQLEPHRGQGFQTAIVQTAGFLASESMLPESRFQAMSWLNNLVPQLTDRGCTDVGNSEAVPAAVKLIQQESEALQTRVFAIEFCLALHERGFLPVGILLEADLHQQLTTLVVQSGWQTYCTPALSSTLSADAWVIVVMQSCAWFCPACKHTVVTIQWLHLLSSSLDNSLLSKAACHELTCLIQP